MKKTTNSKTFNVKKIIKDYFTKATWKIKDNANQLYSYSSVSWKVAGEAITEYTLDNIYPPRISEAHRNGDLHIHNLYMGICGYSFYRNETVLVREKETKKLLCLSLEQLFDLVDKPKNFENGFEIKYTNKYEILDKDGWTDILRVLRHKTKKSLISFNTAYGHNLIVTQDHDFITLTHRRPNIVCPHCANSKIYKIRSKLFRKNEFKDYYRCKACNKTFSKNIEEIKDVTLIKKKSSEIRLNDYAITPGFAKKIGLANNLNLSPRLSWILGLFIADGLWRTDKKWKYLLFELSKNTPEYKKFIKYLNKEKIHFNILEKKDRKSRIIISLQKLPFLFKKLIRQIRPYATDKNLPLDFMNFRPDLVGAVISGIIDGKGIVRDDDPLVSRVNIRLTSKTLLSQIQFWLHWQGLNSHLSTIDSYRKRDFEGLKIQPQRQLYSLTFYIPKSKVRLFRECIKISKNFKYSKKLRAFKEFTSLRKIENIENDNKYVYDITTATHTFIANGILVHNCAGWSVQNLLMKGVGVPGQVNCAPPKHFDSALNQIANFLGVVANEWAGAQAINSLDVLLAPFVRYNSLTYKDVKQKMQGFIYTLNLPTRWGGQTPFTNITFDLKVPDDLADKPVIIGGKMQKEKYKDFQKEVDMINKAFLEIMIEGNSQGRAFTFPIPTYNVTKDFNWNSPIVEKIFEMTAKFGIPYFQNFIRSELDPHEIRAMCCHLRLELSQLKYRRIGGFFGFADQTGSVGVVTINMPRIGYLAKNEKDFFKKLARLMDLARDSLEIKRKVVQDNMNKGLLPFSQKYLCTLRTHFSTLGLIGVHEACLNFLGKGIETKEGKGFALRVLQFMRRRLVEYQKQTDHIYNLEATPAESTAYRFAKIDKEKYPKIKTAGVKVPYYTNSTWLPVNYTGDVFEALEHQNDLQVLYTGGTIFHTFLGERITSKECKVLVKKILENFDLPYITITPTFSICSDHGYLLGEHFKCPKCGRVAEVYSRVVGFLRPVQNWNIGKQEEFKQRLEYKV